MEIEWKGVVGFEEYFKVSNFGDVFSLRTGKILKQHTRKNGYKTIATKIGGRSGEIYCFKVHRLVAEAFILDDNHKAFVNHIDGNKANNVVENLEWVTPSENAKHSFDTGLQHQKKGVDNKLSKLSLKDVLFILKNCRQLGGKMTQRELGKMFNCSHTVIGKQIEFYREDNIHIQCHQN